MIEMPSAMVAAVEAVRMSRLRTWLISCASTPRISRALQRLRIPVVQQTAAWAGLRPVAKAFGEGSSLMYTRGLGMPAAAASSATIWCSSGACWGDTSTAWAARTAMLSLFQ